MGASFKKSDIAVLVSTMNRDNLDFLKPMFPDMDLGELNIVVINQTTPGKIIPLTAHYPIKVINSFEKGLSASRNLALKTAENKLCLLADDDIVYKHDFQDTVLLAFNANPDAALIAFRTENEHGTLFKKYPAVRKEKLSVFNRLSIMSVEMVINNDVVREKDILFNTDFGLGTNFPLGEEAIFVNELYKTGLKIIMEPRVINSHTGISTSERLTAGEKYFTLGAVYSVIFKGKYLLHIFIKLFFDLKQGLIKYNQAYNLVGIAVKGRKKYSKEKNYV